MSDDSPLFVSAIELISHSIEIYTEGDKRKFKFVILHLANAIELILKDCLIDEGVSIYEPKSSRTINIWMSFEKLDKVAINIPERPIIELLVDDRNTIQHRFGFPDAEAVFYYLQRVVWFFERFLDEEYGVDFLDVLRQYLSVDELAIIGLNEEKNKYMQMDKLFDLSPESAVLKAYNAVESKFLEVMDVELDSMKRSFAFWRSSSFHLLLDDLTANGFISYETAEKFDFLREMRNRGAHIAHQFEGAPSLEQWAEAIDIAKNLLKGLDQAIEQGYFSSED